MKDVSAVPDTGGTEGYHESVSHGQSYPYHNIMSNNATRIIIHNFIFSLYKLETEARVKFRFIHR